MDWQHYFAGAWLNQIMVMMITSVVLLVLISLAGC
jgi:hypothetical protein